MFVPSKLVKELDRHLKWVKNHIRITVKTLYKVTRYNRIFNILLKIAGNGSVSIKIPSL